MIFLQYQIILVELEEVITLLIASIYSIITNRHPLTGKWYDCDDSYTRLINDPS